MNENIDLTKILKDCPKGWKLYTPILGEVEFEEICDGAKEEFSITVKAINYGLFHNFTKEGFYFTNIGECVLFPSKEQRDWSKFTAPWYKKERDAIACLETQGEDKKEINNNFDVLPGLYKCIHRMFDGTPDGRLLFEIDNVYKCLSKHNRAEFEVSYGHSVYLEDPIVRRYFIPFEGEQISSQTNERTWLYLVSDVLTWKDGIGQYLDNPRVQEIAKRLCDKYAKKLYNPSVLSNSSNTGKNEQKFDPKTLKPFDKVLVRDECCEKWLCDLYSHYDSIKINDSGSYPYVTINSNYGYCIPYNDETKYLAGTKDEAPKFYRYWED